MTSSARNHLAESLKRRVPTYVVAGYVLKLGAVPEGAWLLLSGLAPYYWHQGWASDDFDQVDPADSQLSTFMALFPNEPGFDPLDPDSIRVAVKRAMGSLVGNPNVRPRPFLIGRVHASGAVRKRLRFLRRLEDKADRIEQGIRLRNAMMQAKSRLAYDVDAQACDDRTLVFIAYIAARANRRSIFQVGPQSRAMDEAAAQLLKDLFAHRDSTNWFEVAKVLPIPRVLKQLDPGQRGRLLGTFHDNMRIAVNELRLLWPALPARMRTEMVMVKGVDSSRWNAYAGAYNTMRMAWVSTVTAAGMTEIFDSYMPGKVARLMASDVAWMYRNAGQDLHEDTRMFARLAHPWNVVSGDRKQRFADVLAAAEAEGVDAEKTGWVGPHLPQQAEATEPEPALVHGVVVSDPQLAATLRRCGVFSAKQLKHVEDLPGFDRHVVHDGGRIYPVASPAASRSLR
jgi:hypothetical protein